MGQIPIGLLGDRFGRKPVIFIGVIIYTLAGIGVAFSTTMSMVLWLRFIQGLGSSVAPVLGKAVARDISSGDKLAKLMSLLVTTIGFGTLIAPIIGSLLVMIGGWKATFFVSPLLGVFLLILMWIYLIETKPNTVIQNPLQQFKESFQSFFSTPQSVVGAIIMGFTFSGYMVLISSTSSIIVDIYGLNSTWVGPIFGLAALTYVSGAFINRRIVTKYGTFKMLSISMLIYGISSTLLGLMTWLGEPNIVLLWVVFSVYLSGMGIMFPNASTITLQPLPNSAGFASAILGTSQLGLSSIVATWTATLYDGTIVSITGVMAVTGALAVLTFLIGRRFINS